ncbi:MAG: beta-galactosidase [Verrucomicrobia bacterium]|nr:beta-galactosidase [Verrucomicrobiota bacterium]
MKKELVGLLVILLLKPGWGLPSGTITESSRDLPPDYRHSNTLFGNLPGSLFGPRIAWAEPHVLGKLKLLIILPYGTTHEAVELRSRIPAEVSLITLATHDKWVNTESAEPAYEPVPSTEILNDTAHRLLSPGYRYDAIVIGKVRWSVIPPAIQNKILEKARGGTALVWISPWDVDADLRKQMGLSEADNPLAKSIQAAVPLGILPLDVDFEKTSPKHFAARRIGPPEIRTGKLGGGNVVWLDYQDRIMKDNRQVVHAADPWQNYSSSIALTPFVADDDLYYDYYFSILGKALYHATGKTTGVLVRAQQPVVTVERQKLPSAAVSFAVDLVNKELRDWSMVYELRDRHNRVLQKGPAGDLIFSEKTARFAPPLPRLSQGTYVVDVWAVQRGAVLDWASAALVVTDTKYLETVQPAKEFFARKDRICGMVKFATPLAKGLSVAVELWDTHDRLVTVAKLEKKNGEFEFPPIANPLSRAYRLVAQVKEKDFALDQTEAWIGLPSNEVDDYQFVMYANAINQRSNRTAMRQCKQYAVTGYYDLTTWMPRELMFESADGLARNNLLAYPYSYGLWSFKIAPDRKFEDTLKEYRDRVYPPRIEAYRRYGTMAYSTCEESFIERKEEAWNNPEALQDYRRYLKERYGDVARLNEVWGSKFKDFDEIGLISFVEAKTGRQPTRWMEQELHKVDRFNRVQDVTHQTIQEMDPGARASLDCIEGMDFDWPRMAKITRAFTQCPLESFNKDQGNLVGTWIGYYLNNMDEWIMRTTPWQYLFQGGTHVIWWPVTYAFTLDLSEPMLCMKQAAEECRELESGAGKLLLASRKRLDPILLLWSNTSYYAGILNPDEVNWKAARDRFDSLLRRTGFDYQAVDAEFIEKSLVYGDQQRVLILPACQSISRKGVEKIKAFAEAGGVVIADFPPAVVDEYLRPYGQPQAAGEVTFETCAKCAGKKRVEVGNVWQACPACSGTGQTMKGGSAPTRSLLEDVFDFSKQGAKKIGKGHGLFLKGPPDRREEWGGIRKSLIEKAGLRGDIEVQDPLGNLRSDVRSFVFDNGRAMFLGMIPDRALNNPPGEDLIVKLGRKLHAYDVRRHQYLGETDALRTGILPTEAKLLAFLPERIEGLNVSLAKETAKAGEVIELKGLVLPASLKDSPLVVRIEVSKDGHTQEAHTKNLAFPGVFTHPIPLALNQKRGVYRVKIMEVISGYTQEMKFSVK